MAYRYNDRNQIMMFPQTIEEYISSGDTVRAYDAFVDALNLNELGIVLDPDKVGKPEYGANSLISSSLTLTTVLSDLIVLASTISNVVSLES